jgi:hypothetical protein
MTIRFPPSLCYNPLGIPERSPSGHASSNRRNRANAQKSTGPRTPEGCDAVRLNGLRHGLRAETAVLPIEDPAEFDHLKQQLESELQPIGAQETILFEDIVLAAWRLRRARAYETALTARLYRGAQKHLVSQHVEPEPMKCFGLMLHEDAEGKKVLDYVARIEGRYRRTYHQSIKELRQLQATRPPAQTIAVQATPEPLPPPELALVAQAAATAPVASTKLIPVNDGAAMSLINFARRHGLLDPPAGSPPSSR